MAQENIFFDGGLKQNFVFEGVGELFSSEGGKKNLGGAGGMNKIPLEEGMLRAAHTKFKMGGPKGGTRVRWSTTSNTSNMSYIWLISNTIKDITL